MNSDFIPVIGISSILIIVLGFIAIMRYISYKENLLFAEKGLTRPEQKNEKGLLRWGIIITALGFVPLFLGLGLTLLHYLIEKE
jgi:hypothetical protein